MRKAGVFVISIITLILISAATTAVQINSGSSTTDAIKIQAGEYVQRTYALALNSNETVIINTPSISLSGVLASISQSYYTQSGSLTVSFFAQSNAEVGTQNLNILLQSSNPTLNGNLYINLTVKTTMFEVYNNFVQKGSILQVGNNIKIRVNGAAPDVSYTVSGCGYDQNMIVAKDTAKTFNCGDTKMTVTPTELYVFGDSVAIKMLIEANENFMVSPYVNETENAPCELSLNTISQAQRGRLFGLEAVDSDGKPVKDVSVILTDTGLGGADDMHEVTDRTGYASVRISEDAVGPLIIRLSKDGCEAFNKQIEFGVSYEAYQATRIREAQGKKLMINGTTTTLYSGDSLSGTINTGLGDKVDGAEVRAMSTKTEKVYSVTTNKQGRFQFDTLDEDGDWTIQAKKDGYELSDEITVTVQVRKYLSLVSIINGNYVNNGITGQKIQFQIKDSRGELMPIATQVRFGNQNINVVDGTSDTVTLNDEGTITANVAQQPGYTAATATIIVKKNLLYYYAGAVAGLIVLIIIIGAIKGKGKRPLSYGMGSTFDQGEIATSEA